MDATGLTRLTRNQNRKPLLGSGSAAPVDFGPIVRTGTLIMGSDGLFKYVQAKQICALVVTHSATVAATELVNAARLPNMELQDDISVIVVKALESVEKSTTER